MFMTMEQRRVLAEEVGDYITSRLSGVLDVASIQVTVYNDSFSVNTQTHHVFDPQNES